MNQRYILAGLCDGWDIPMHETDEDTEMEMVIKPSGTELQLCPRCLTEYRKDFPRIEAVKQISCSICGSRAISGNVCLECGRTQRTPSED